MVFGENGLYTSYTPNGQAAVSQRLSYDAWGKRRNGNWTDAISITSLTHHGFTGHEMLDDVGLINMNARIYDPTLGRFIQADPTVQSPGNPQTLNRYSYAGNNPLTYVDPSGYGFFSSLWNAVKGVVRIVVAVVAAYFVAIYAAAYFSILSGNAIVGGILGGAFGGFTAGFIGSGGNMQAAWGGALTGAIFGGIGAYADGMQAGGGAGWGSGGVNRVLAHAAGGGISSTLQGQKFGPAALAAGFTQGFAPAIDGISAGGAGGVIARTTAAAVVGGTASVIGGGKFENGAKTAAFSRLFNDELHRSDKPMSNVERSKSALSNVFGQDVSSVNIVENSFRARLFGAYATTGVNTIYVNDSLSGFFENDFTVLEEYYHVLNQWNTGAMTTSSYLYESRNGYGNNKYEIEAKSFAGNNLKLYQDLKTKY